MYSSDNDISEMLKQTKAHEEKEKESDMIGGRADLYETKNLSDIDILGNLCNEYRLGGLFSEELLTRRDSIAELGEFVFSRDQSFDNSDLHEFSNYKCNSKGENSLDSIEFFKKFGECKNTYNKTEKKAAKEEIEMQMNINKSSPFILRTAGYSENIDSNEDFNHIEGRKKDKIASLLDIQKNHTKKQRGANNSYATMIITVLETTPRGKLTLKEIYEALQRFYPENEFKGTAWQNSVRHNLSLNRCFKKIQRTRSEPGKGGFWAVDYDFLEKQKELKEKGEKMEPMTTRNIGGSRKRRRENYTKDMVCIRERDILKGATNILKGEIHFMNYTGNPTKKDEIVDLSENKLLSADLYNKKKIKGCTKLNFFDYTK
eukprot:GHVP01068796.1.p2 GENE.GHVP01068796.1~~GHVP01068796.1.p2  ORF type:complete len:374 (+),score=68.34 GHVP01068796.1:2422-3543(+)